MLTGSRRVPPSLTTRWHAARRKNYERQVTAAWEGVEQRNAEVDEFEDAVRRGDSEPVAQLFTLVLDCHRRYPFPLSLDQPVERDSTANSDLGGSPSAADAGGTGSALRAEAGEDDIDDDVWTADSLQREVTELLLTSVPSLTAAQVVEVRAAIVKLAAAWGWVAD